MTKLETQLKRTSHLYKPLKNGVKQCKCGLILVGASIKIFCGCLIVWVVN